MDEAEELGPGLLAVFAALPDTRGRHGRRHPLPAILALATAAMLSGARSLYAIGQWGRLQRSETLRALRFTRSATPSVSTLHVVFRGLDVAAFETALSTWARAPNAPTLAIDGKGLRGIHGEESPGVRLVAAYCDEAGLVLAQKGVRIGTLVDEHDVELLVAPRPLQDLPPDRAVVTADALYCQRAVCQQIVAAGGDYLVIVKGNQPRLHNDIVLPFDSPPDETPLAFAQQRDRHGDRHQERRVLTSGELFGCLDWPRARQVGKVERVALHKGQTRQQVRYFVTSLPAPNPHLGQTGAGPEQLL